MTFKLKVALIVSGKRKQWTFTASSPSTSFILSPSRVCFSLTIFSSEEGLWRRVSLREQRTKWCWIIWSSSPSTQRSRPSRRHPHPLLSSTNPIFLRSSALAQRKSSKRTETTRRRRRWTTLTRFLRERRRERERRRGVWGGSSWTHSRWNRLIPSPLFDVFSALCYSCSSLFYFGSTSISRVVMNWSFFFLSFLHRSPTSLSPLRRRKATPPSPLSSHQRQWMRGTRLPMRRWRTARVRSLSQTTT